MYFPDGDMHSMHLVCLCHWINIWN